LIEGAVFSETEASTGRNIPDIIVEECVATDGVTGADGATDNGETTGDGISGGTESRTATVEDGGGNTGTSVSVRDEANVGGNDLSINKHVN
jgi:hypothetical protein